MDSRSLIMFTLTMTIVCLFNSIPQVHSMHQINFENWDSARICRLHRDKVGSLCTIAVKGSDGGSCKTMKVVLQSRVANIRTQFEHEIGLCDIENSDEKKCICYGNGDNKVIVFNYVDDECSGDGQSVTIS